MEIYLAFVNLVLTIVSIWFGSGFVLERWRLKQAKQDQEQKRYRDILDTFLSPLEGHLSRTREISDDLFRNLPEDKTNLEYQKDIVGGWFENLPENNVLRYTWRQSIASLHERNKQAVALIDANWRKICLDDFRQACSAFRRHAEAWASFWEAITEDLRDKDIQALPFPKQLDCALQKEIREVEQRAGMNNGLTSPDVTC